MIHTSVDLKVTGDLFGWVVLKTFRFTIFFLFHLSIVGLKYLLGQTFEKIRPCLVGRKFSVFYIQTFRKQGKHV